MMFGRRTARTFCGLLLLLGMAASGSPAFAEMYPCPAFPNVPWWKGLSHERVVQRVRTDHLGDWQPYIAKWQGELERLTKAHGRGGGARFSGVDGEIRGEDLAAYISAIAHRLVAVRCLANVQGNKEGSKCPPFRKARWWPERTHEAAVDFVSRTHLGDWKPYIAKAEGDVRKLTKAHDMRRTVIVSETGEELAGEDVADFIAAATQRLVVLRCLATESAAR